MPTHADLLYALVPAAGSGERAGGGKLYRRLAGDTVIAHALAALAGVRRITNTLVVIAADDVDFAAQAPDFGGWWEPCGGATRAASVRAGLAALQRRGVHSHDWVLVHDAARCLVPPAAIDRLIDSCIGDDVGGLLALPLADTLKVADAQGRVSQTIDRSGKWVAQTPQMFRLGLLAEALEHAGDAVTDESSAVEALGYAPKLVVGDADNFKLTWPEDFAHAERVLAARMAA
jgi:2-C-methyl-D-erythritol 4-phosphate cytidylyltransferase